MTAHLPELESASASEIAAAVRSRGAAARRRSLLEAVEARVAQVAGVARVVVDAGETGAEPVVVVEPQTGRGPTFRGHPRHVLPNGLAPAYLNRHELEHLYAEIFERDEYGTDALRGTDTACVLDVGANIGMFALRIRELAPAACAVAVEPSPEAYAVLAANVELYDVGAELCPFGLGAEDGEAPFTYYPDSSVFSSFFADPERDSQWIWRAAEAALFAAEVDATPTVVEELLARHDPPVAKRVAVRRLSGVIRELGIDRVDFLKVDTEGSELDVLRGIDEPDWRNIDRVAVEVHDAGGTVTRSVVSLLRSQGFAVEHVETPLSSALGFAIVRGARRPAAARTVRGNDAKRAGWIDDRRPLDPEDVRAAATEAAGALDGAEAAVAAERRRKPTST